MVKLEALLQHIEKDCCIHWVANGEWSMHELLIGLLHQAGPSDVYLSSYAFSEHPARIIADLKSRNMIKDLHCLIDSRIDVRGASALTMIRDIATSCKMLNTHAKVTLVLGETLQLAVVGSANYTTNKRYEAGVIIAHPEAVLFHKKWMQDELNRNK